MKRFKLKIKRRVSKYLPNNAECRTDLSMCVCLECHILFKGCDYVTMCFSNVEEQLERKSLSFVNNHVKMQELIFPPCLETL